MATAKMMMILTNMMTVSAISYREVNAFGGYLERGRIPNEDDFDARSSAVRGEEAIISKLALDAL